VYQKYGLIRVLDFVGRDLIREGVAFGGMDLTTGMVFGGRDLMRGVAFGGRGLITERLLYQVHGLARYCFIAS